jgi:hypothetical protein
MKYLFQLWAHMEVTDMAIETYCTQMSKSRRVKVVNKKQRMAGHEGHFEKLCELGSRQFGLSSQIERGRSAQRGASAPGNSSFGRSLEFRYRIVRGHSPLPCIRSAAALNTTWNFRAHLLPAEMVTASLIREREKGDKTFATI